MKAMLSVICFREYVAPAADPPLPVFGLDKPTKWWFFFNRLVQISI